MGKGLGDGAQPECSPMALEWKPEVCFNKSLAPALSQDGMRPARRQGEKLGDCSSGSGDRCVQT